ncbi:MAG: endolytic transglycosylase MltG [Lachnospiraceae bacterium]|nr:endolytic transglycosylase MltG [Lachnospiraceae bacterium]
MTGDKRGISATIFWFMFRMMINAFLILVLVEGFTGGYYFSYKLFSDVPYVATSKETMNITIESGTDVSTVGTILAENGIVDGKYIFIARAYISGYHDDIQAGTYVLGPGMSPSEICQTICNVQSEGET